MAQRSVQEAFRAIRPRSSRGIPEAPLIDVGVTSSNGDLSASLSEAGQQIARLQAAYRQQEALFIANTQAIQSNTSAHAGNSALGTAGKVATGFFGGALGLLAPILTGLGSLFGEHATPAAIPIYVPPQPIAIEAQLSTGTASATHLSTALPTSSAPGTNSASPVSQITVNVSAMDSQSFMDRSSDIASAVREAMLNLHPINDVIANL